MNRLIISSVEESVTGASEIVDLTAIKAFLELTGTSDFDTLLTSLITTARKNIENYTGLSLIEKDMVMYCEQTPDEYFELRCCPYDADLAITDEDDNAITDFKELGIIYKSIKYDSANPIIISYSTAQADDEELKTAIKVHVALLFESRTGFLISKENLNKTGLNWKSIVSGLRRPYKVL